MIVVSRFVKCEQSQQTRIQIFNLGLDENFVLY